MVSKQLLKKLKRVPNIMNKEFITQDEFDAVLANPELRVVEKHIHNTLETNQVLFVIDENDEIDFAVIKRITENGVEIYKETEGA